MPIGSDDETQVEQRDSGDDSSVELGDALILDGSECDGLGKLVRHERHLMNTLVKTLQVMLLLRGSRDQEEVMA